MLRQLNQFAWCELDNNINNYFNTPNCIFNSGKTCFFSIIFPFVHALKRTDMFHRFSLSEAQHSAAQCRAVGWQGIDRREPSVSKFSFQWRNTAAAAIINGPTYVTAQFASPAHWWRDCIFSPPISPVIKLFPLPPTGLFWISCRALPHCPLLQTSVQLRTSLYKDAFYNSVEILLQPAWFSEKVWRGLVKNPDSSMLSIPCRNAWLLL